MFEVRAFSLPGRPLLLGALVGSLALAGCGGGGSSSSDDNDFKEFPPLPDATGEVVSERYQVLGEDGAIVLDTKTNLAWKRCHYGQTWSTDLGRCEGSATTVTWDVATGLVDEDGFRLASMDELKSLVYCNNLHNGPDQIGELDIFEGCGAPTLSPTIDPQAFPDIGQVTVWTSDDSPNSETLKLGLNFVSGVASDFNSEASPYRLIVVRDPADGDEPRAANGSRPRKQNGS